MLAHAHISLGEAMGDASKDQLLVADGRIDAKRLPSRNRSVSGRHPHVQSDPSALEAAVGEADKTSTMLKHARMCAPANAYELHASFVGT